MDPNLESSSMCDTISVVAGPVLETPDEFVEWFEVDLIPYGTGQASPPGDYPCFCGSDLDVTLKTAGISYIYDGMGYIVGTNEELKQLDNEDVIRSFFGEGHKKKRDY